MPPSGLEPERPKARDFKSLVSTYSTKEANIIYGEHGRTRTLDLVIRSHLLYPAELRADSGALSRTRTGTLLLARDFKSLVSTIPPRGLVWWAHQDSNLEPFRYERKALTN